MKKVINSNPKNTITLKEVLSEDNPIIGFDIKYSKVTLIPLKYRSNKYLARCVDEWGNGFDPQGVDVYTIAEWEEFFRINFRAEMFVFDSPKELFKWLAE
jgi:hypothetical protein